MAEGEGLLDIYHVKKYMEWTHMMRVFVFNASIDRMSKQWYVLWREVNHEIFRAACKEVWNFLWGAPKESERGHVQMWLC